MPPTPGLSTMFTPAADLDHPVTMRHAGRELLSLALIDARNRSLRLFAAFEAAARPDALDGTPPPLQGSPLWWLGQLGWYQEHWIARNVQRHRGRRCDARGIRLASIDPRADLWWDPRLRSPVERGATDLPRAAAVRQYLADTLEVTLELLMEAPEQDETLYFYRDALFHEDRQAERLIEAAQMLDVPLPEATAPGAWVPHQPLAVSAGHWHIGIAPEQGGYVFESERGRRLDSCPDHDIDAQPVSWQQFLEFVADGGYRQSRWWSPVGWNWVCAQQRTGPVMAEDPADGLVQTRFGRAVRVHPNHPVVHVNLHEAQAWCRWAGRRLPSEVEWTHAAERLGSQGFRWGEVWEWTADRLVALEPDMGDCNLPQREAFLAACTQHHRVLRGGATVTRPRLRDARHRNHRLPEDQHGLTGFRSCAL